MRALHLVSSPTLTGPAAPALGLARGLRALGVDAVIACDRVRTGDLIDKAREAGVPLVEGSRLCARVALRDAFADCGWLARTAASFDFVHTHASHDHALAAIAARGTRLVRSIHHPRGTERRALRRWVYARTHGFVVLNSEDRADLTRSYPVVETIPVVVAEGAVDTDRFHPDVSGEVLRTSFGFGADDQVVGFVSRIKPGRGHGSLLTAFEMAYGQNARLRLALIGKGEGTNGLVDDVRSRGLSSVVRFYGFRDEDLPAAIRSCDVTVLLESGNDGSCRAVLESLACGVPVIGRNLPAIGSALRDSRAGWLVESTEPKAWARALTDYFRLSDEERRGMGQAARAQILEKFTEARRARAVMSLYRRLQARGRLPS